MTKNEFNLIEQEEIRKTCDQLVKLLDSTTIECGASAMICLLINEAMHRGLSVQHFLGIMHDAWKYYEEENNGTN